MRERDARVLSRARSAFGRGHRRDQASRKSERRAHGVRHTWLLAQGEPQTDRSGRKAAQQYCTGVTRTECHSWHPIRTPPPDRLIAPQPTRCTVRSRQSTRCRSSRQGRGCSRQCVRRGERDHGRRRCARHLPRPPRAQGIQRRVEPDADPQWHAGMRAEYEKATNDAAAQNNNGLKVHGDATSPLQGFLWRPMRPVWKLPRLTHRKHAVGNTRTQVQKVPLPCQYPDATANRPARPGVDNGSRYLSLRNRPGRNGCAAPQAEFTRTLRHRSEGL